MKNLFFRSLFILSLFTIGASTGVFAMTPDGSPPSEEAVCDELTGAAHGLCNAFCEAMDCDSEDAKASENACEKMLDRYMKLEETAPPCLEQEPTGDPA
jgi:hypothetical protein